MKSNNFLRSTLRIARIELNTLFYSPVAWLVLVIFAFQVGMKFAGAMDHQIHAKMLDYSLFSVTKSLFSGLRGVFPPVVNSLYLYIPLISMGLMSREYSSGSIKLLYSSPISNSSIILGKYLAILVYGLALMALIGCCVIYGAIAVDNFDMPLVLTSMLGVFLLLCTYSAIGLLMSTLTSYQVVAGIGTLAILAGLNYVGQIGQGIPFVQDITYWLSMTGRVYEFIDGMIPSESVIYFLGLIVFFVGISIAKLNFDRHDHGFKRFFFIYSGACLGLILVAFVSSRPHFKFYYDASYTQSNTLSQASLRIMERLDGPLTITTYVNMLDRDAVSATPGHVKSDFNRFEKYLRFKPDIRMNYVYYWADCGNESLKVRYPNNTNAEIAGIICDVNGMKFNNLLNKEQVDRMAGLASEGYRFRRIIERENGQKVVLRVFDDSEHHPGEAEISAALKCFLEPSPRVAIVSGHGDRTMNNWGSRGYNSFSRSLDFRKSLVNQGFAPEELNLLEGNIPEGIDILVLADLKTPLSAVETERLNAYIARGGNMYLLCDGMRTENMNPVVRQLGIEFGPDVLVSPVKDQDPTILPAVIAEQAAEIFPRYRLLRMLGYRVGLLGSVDIRPYGSDSAFRMIPLLKSDTEGVWNERETKDFIEDSVIYNPAAGEIQQEYLLAAAFTRPVGDKEQRIVVAADADCISNEGLSPDRYWFSTTNYSMIDGTFHWMSYGQFPIDTSHPRPIDNAICLDRSDRMWNKVVMTGVFPGLLLVIGLVLIVKRQRG